MFHRVYLLAALLVCCTGESSADDPPEAVWAFAGGVAILPCSVKIPPSDNFPTVEWSKEDLQPNIVFLYRDGCEIYEMKNQAFHYRTSFVTKELKDGNISLRISNIRPSDAGRYRCMTLWKNGRRDITTVELVVVSVSEPKLSVVSAESGRVTLQCEADCWLPEPEIEFLDDRGKSIPADDPKRNPDTGGCFTVTRRVTLQDAASRVTCRVHQPEINQTRDTKIILPGDCMRCSLITGIAVGEGVLLLIAACGLAFYFLRKRCGKSEAQKPPVTRQSSDQTTVSGTDEDQPFLQRVTVDGADSTTDRLTREVADPKSKFLEKEETVHLLQNNLKSQPNPVDCCQVLYSPSKSSQDVADPFSPPSIHSPETRNLPDDHNPKPAASTHTSPSKSVNMPQNQGLKPDILGPNSNPEPNHPIHRPCRINSSPALFNFPLLSSSSSASASKKKHRSFHRSMSESGARPGPNHPRLQRRHSSVLSTSDNGFSRLTDLSEESDS